MGSIAHEDGRGLPPDVPFLPPLAVIGLSFRFPQEAVTAKEFWKMLIEKRCASTETPSDRWNVDSHYHPDNNRNESLSIRGGHYMTGDLAAFDAPFFSITAAEAEAMDPSQRLTLETAYHAIENAGLSMENIAGTKTCVFSGSFSRDYATMLDHDPDIQAKYRATGTATNMLANRVSWFFDLLGPSVNVDTACSSSLIAVDLACQSIWAGDSAMGLACGSNTMFTPEFGMALDNLGMLGPDSRCYSFDHRANGYARGEGFGVLVIKPLDAALRDGDTVRAVIRSSCSNQDGKTPGVTQPSREAQERLIIDTYAKAGLDLGVTRYFEAHGTGTPVGDPIEAGAIGAAFRKHRTPDDPLYVGSVKSNIGHLEGASGVAGVIKAILALEAGVIPPNSNFEKLNPKIDAKFWNIKIATDAVPWPTDGLRRASVQSFGFGGANSHIVLDDAYNFLRLCGRQGNHNTLSAPPKRPEYLGEAHGNGVSKEAHPYISNGTSNGYTSHGNGISNGHPANGLPIDHSGTAASNNFPKLLVWSTMDESGVDRVKTVWKEYFAGLDLPSSKVADFVRDMAYTLASRRSSFPWRTFSVAKDADGISSLADHLPTATRAGAPKVAFVFSGQGAQWHAMGRELLQRYPLYRSSLVDAGLYLTGLGCPWNPIEELSKDKDMTLVNDPYYSQTLCTVVQIGLIDVMDSFGVRPAAVVGHSSGEIAAAFCTGALSRQAAWKIAYFRGLLAAKLTKISQTQGTMMAVGLPSAEASKYLSKVAEQLGESRLVVACVNSPKNVTISGDAAHIKLLKDELDQSQVFARELKVPVAYHSFQMREIADEYLSKLGSLGKPSGPLFKIAPPMVSSVTGDWISTAELADPKYWVRNLVSPVLFAPAVATLCSRAPYASKTTTLKLDGSHYNQVSVSALIEVGPHAALQGPIREILQSINQESSITYMSILVRNKSAVHTALEVAGRLYSLGHPLDLEQVNREVTWIGKGRRTIKPQKTLTTLPEYPFNHSKSYWTESRLSKNYRFRPYPKHDLLGVQAIDWNPLEAKWRNVIKHSEVPWVEDHKINNTILYPAAGMLVMVIEACKQLADQSKALSGFLFKDVSFHSALNVPNGSAGVEVNLCVRPQKDQDEKDTGMHSFRIYTYSNDVSGWLENCNGSIQIVYELAENEVDEGREQQEWISSRRLRYLDGVQSCTNEVDAETLYGRLADCGYGYGPTFRAISKLLHNGDDTTVADVEVYRWADYYPGRDPDQPHVIHPTTLDCILQGILTTHTKGGTEQIPTAIPTHVKKLWISKSGLSYADASQVKVYATGHRIGMRETESHLITLDSTGTHVLIDADCFKATDIGSDTNRDEDQEYTVTPNLCHTVDWKVDIDLLSTQELQAFCDTSVPDEPEPIEFYTEVDFLLTAYMKRSLVALEGVDVSQWKTHTQKYFSWMKHRMSLLDRKDSMFSSSEWKARLDDEQYIDRLTEKIAATNKQGLFYTTVGKHHIKLLTGEENALSLLFDGDLVKDHYYEIEEESPAIQRLGAVIDAMVHKNPGAKFLEIGAGTGAMTHQVMKTLTHHGDGEICSAPRYAQYDYTDLSPVFFADAQAKHGPNSRMQFKVLNIELDPELQGFECGTYDGIFAAAVLHATPNLAKTLEHCRKLLKPGGKLMLSEPTMGSEGLRTNFAFGLLEGWWLSTESFRELSPCLHENKWGEVFAQTGFSGNDYVLYDYKSPKCHELSVLISTAVQEKSPEPVDSTTEIVIVHGSDGDSEILAHTLQSNFRASSEFTNRGVSRIRISSFGGALDENFDGDSLFVFLLEFSNPVWFGIKQQLYESLQKLLTWRPTTKSLWVAFESGIGTKELPAAPPSYRLVDGLSRVINSEVDGAALTCLTLQPAVLEIGEKILNDKQIGYIVQISERLLEHSDADIIIDTEYTENNATLRIPRLIETTVLNEEIYKRVIPQQTIQRQWAEAGGVPLRLVVGSPGLLNTLHFVEDKERDPNFMPPNEVEVEVRSVGLNFRDLLIALGRLQQRTVGCECAGIVTRIGSAVPSGAFQIGDRVASFPFDTYKSYVRIDWRAVSHVPDEIPLTIAAAVPVNYVTAWLAFQNLARLQSGETVLIHSAAGGTGQAAIQVAQYLGATVLVTVGIETKKQFLMETYGIPGDHIFSSRDPTSFSRGVKRVTSGKGVDVVFNSLSGEGLIASWECIAPYGRFVEIGKKDILARNPLSMAQFEKNVTFSALDISTFPRDRPHVSRKVLEEVYGLIVQGKLSPSKPLQVYGVSELEKAFRTMQSGKTFGKLVVEMRPDDVVNATLDTKGSFSLDANGTYVIAGGLGGIGRSIASWLVDRGAQNLILLSRSGPKNPHAQKLIEELAEKGAKVVTPVSDICDAAALETTLKSCLEAGMPPIKGCIQASMVLRDAAFAGMTYDAWQAATAPKVEGSWNLHLLLPKDLDFFVTLSSICGVVGSRGQANYAAGNTFQDALVRYRVSIGQRAAAIDLGPLFSMGVMTEDSDMRKRWEEMVDAPVTEADLYALLDYYCNPVYDEGRDSSLTAPFRCQAVVGLARWLSDKTELYFRKPMANGLTIHNNMSAAGQGKDGRGEERVNFASVFASATLLSEAAEAVTQALARKLASTLSLTLEELDMATPMHSYGVDSLVAVELRNWFAKEVHADIAIFDILGGATIATAGLLAATKSKYHKAEWSG